MYTVTEANAFLRPIGASAIDFKIGKSTQLFPEWMPGIVELDLTIACNNNGSEKNVHGVAGDWPAFAWLDKRETIGARQKLNNLLVRLAALCKLIKGFSFENPIDAWRQIHPEAPPSHDSVPYPLGTSHEVTLCETFCRAMLERAVIDGYCRSEDLSFAAWLQTPIVNDFVNSDFSKRISFAKPVEHIDIRHTIGLADSLLARTTDDQTSLEWAIDFYGLRFFKIKVSGDTEFDIQRLDSIWKIIGTYEPTITIDGNEAFRDADSLSTFVTQLADAQPKLLERTRFLEQPLPRDLTLDRSTEKTIRNIAKVLPLAIDEADCHLDSFARAIQLGYSGVSHKNCKGVLKSLRNYRLTRNDRNAQLFLTGEDLTNVPLIPLHQDLTVASCLGLTHIERNGHHYFPSISQFDEEFTQSLLQDYPNLYHSRSDWNGPRQIHLRIEKGKMNVSDLHRYSGLGICQLPCDSRRKTVHEYLEKP